MVLATGGFGQVFSATTNPPVSTGDGVALALRAGAEVADLEFVQFHPTVLWLGPDSRGRQPLISEAVRGEGAFLVDGAGQRFMTGQHPLADLAPRDVVAKAIMREMIIESAPITSTWTAAHLGAEAWQHRFPTIPASCREHGIDPVTELIPVVPGRALRQRRRAHRPARPHQRARPVRLRRVRLHRRARRQPACLQLTARRPGLRRADRRRPGQRSCPARRQLPPEASPAADGAPAVLLDPPIVGPLQQLMIGQRGRAALWRGPELPP